MMNTAAYRPPLADLDARGLQILSLLSRGRSYRDVADILSESYRSVIGTCSNLRRKLGVRSLSELLRLAIARSQPSGPRRPRRPGGALVRTGGGSAERVPPDEVAAGGTLSLRPTF